MGLSHSAGYYRTADEAAEPNGDQTGKVYIVTGAYSGIGVETVRALLKQNATVFIGGRNAELQDKFLERMRDEFEGAAVDGAILDLADLDSVRTFVAAALKKHPKVDVLINNAGVMNTPAGVTKQGIEIQVGTNVVGHFLLTKLLIGALEKGDAGAGKGRVVFLSSLGHSLFGGDRFNFEYFDSFDVSDPAYNGWWCYQQSKLGDILLARAFRERHNVEGVAVHPGSIITNLGRYTTVWSAMAMLSTFFSRVMWEETPPKSAEAGASTTLTVATTPEIVDGGYYANCELKPTAPCADVEEDWNRLYEWCDAKCA